MSAFRRNGRWCAKFQRQGKQVWIPGGPWPSKKMATEAERQHRAHLDSRPSEISCAAFAEQWLRDWPRPAVSTQRLYKSGADRFAADFGSQPLAGVDRFTARTWALGVSRKTSKIVGAMYQDALNVGLVESNPFANLRIASTEGQTPIRVPTLAELGALCEATTTLGGYGAEFRAMLQFAAWTGLRAGEVFALRWEDVSEAEVRVCRTLKADDSYGPPKNGKVRSVPFLAPARVLDDVPRRPDELVFHTVRGSRLTKPNHLWSWNKVRFAAGLSDLRWHSLRHFCATQLLEMGLSHFDVSVQLGHEDGGALVMRRYGHPSVDAAKARLLGAFEFDPAETGSGAGSRTGQGRA